MSTANKLIYLNETKTKIKDVLNCGGADITTETFREYPEVLYNQYVDSAFDGESALWDAMPKFSASGTNLSFNNTVNCRLGTELYGNTSQYSTTGKNLLKNYATNTSSNGITYIIDKYGGIYAKGTATATSFILLQTQQQSQIFEIGTYTFSLKNEMLTNSRVRFEFFENDMTTKPIMFDLVTGKSVTKTINQNLYLRVSYIFYSGAIADNFYNIVQVEKGNTASQIEPYTGGYASPSPNWQQPIHTVTGRNDIQVCGKNKFSVTLEQGAYLASDGRTLVTSDKYVRTNKKIIVKPNTTYTFSLSTTYCVWTLFYYNKEGVFIGTSDNFNVTNNTFVTNENTYSININFYNSNGITPSNITNIMLEESLTATTYENYKGVNYEINLGKNLFDITTASTESANYTMVKNNNSFTSTKVGTGTGGMFYFKSQLMQVKANTNYTLSISDFVTTSQRTNINVYVYSNALWGDQIAPNKRLSVNSPLTFNTGNNTTMIIGFFDEGSIEQGKSFTITGFQVEKSPIATSYAPYFTPIELNTIGDYQDAIVSWRSNTYLPNEYTQVQYIESSGTQYIDTNLFPTNNTSIEIEAKCMSLTEGEGLFGSRVEAGVNDFRIIMASSGKYSIGLGDTYYMLTGDTDKNLWFLSNTIVKKNDIILKEKISNIYTSSYKLYIFAVNSNGNLISSGKWQLFKAKIYENNILVRNFIPCIRNSDNKPGLYDTVTQLFFVNKGTGEFTYGLKANKWYLHKKIGKIVLDGSETWGTFDTTHHRGNITYTNLDITPKSYNSNCLSNYFVYANTEQSIGFNLGASALYLRIDDTFTDITQFKNWLSTNKPTFNLPLATPTETEIANGELINQLEALYHAKSISGQTNIMQDNTDLPFIINASVIQPYSYEEELM